MNSLIYPQHRASVARRQSRGPRVPLPRWKRSLDIGCCIAAVPLLGTVAFLLAVVAGGATNGPIIFRQEAIGHQGRPLRLYRFRTMRPRPSSVGAGEERSTPGEPVKPRLVPGGRFLRSSGLAELPQIVNVWRGEMSIVGPRPQLGARDPAAMPDGIPGLIGLSQWREEDSVSLAAKYAAHRSLWLDVRLIARTLLCYAGIRSPEARPRRLDVSAA